MPQVGHRLTSSELLKAIETIRATSGALDTVEAEQSATTMIADYDGFLESLQLVDKRDALADCGLDDGLELVQLQQMDTSDLQDDILEDPDLALAEEIKASFLAAVTALKDQQQAGETSSSGVHEIEKEADGRPALWAALGMADEQQGEDVASLRRQLAEKDAALKQALERLSAFEGSPP